MLGPMHRNKSVSIHKFSMVPRADIPRSTFIREFTHKTTFDENYLVPIFVDEVLPGDVFQMSMTGFARLTTPLFPIMDNLYLDSFWFFVPNRICWTNWVKFMGEQDNPADTISYTIPTVAFPAGTGATVGSLYNYMGVPTGTQLGGGANGITINNLPGRAYNRIYNDWFRDENLQNSVTEDVGNGPDTLANYSLLKRGKRHDYFTACLPWTQKGGVAITTPLAGNATVKTFASNLVTGTQNASNWLVAGTGATPANTLVGMATGAMATVTGAAASPVGIYPSNLYADLSTATSVTINQLRQSFQIQKFLERDARSGTRYPELIRAHFGVVNPDFRMQRAEFLGSGTTPVSISPIPQTSASAITGSTTPIGSLSGYGQVVAHGHGFSQTFTEHGHVIGLINVRSDLTYQQGLRKLWSRSTRYDFYDPAFAMLGEQAVLNQEIYCIGTTGNDTAAFGYQERWAEYRYLPSMITGQFNSTVATPLDAWHLAEKFTVQPTLSATFIQQNTPISRVSAVPVANTHFIFDGFFKCKTTRCMPMYSVPGLVDHF